MSHVSVACRYLTGGAVCGFYDSIGPEREMCLCRQDQGEGADELAAIDAAHHFNNDLRYRDSAHVLHRQLTPEYVLEPVRVALNGIDLDPCTEPNNPTKAERFYAPPQDGRVLPWDAESIYVNPPYGRAKEMWVRRCVQAGAAEHKVILLIPAHTDTRTFQTALRSAHEVAFIRGRVKFGVLRENGRQEAATHPSALFAWNVSLACCAHLGSRVWLGLPGDD